MSYERPYAGVKVVDLSQGIAGPYAAMLLAQHGAEVVKVEPFEGDWARSLGARYGEHTAFSIAGNLGKQAIAVDLKAEEGQAVVRRLAAGADLFVEGFRPGVTARLGLGYEALAANNPRLLYVSVSGFGQKGPLAARPGMDPVLQAFTGMVDANRGNDGIPHRVPYIPVDMTTALYAFQAIAAALHARRDEPRGRYIDVNLLQSAASVQIVRMMATHLEGGAMQTPRVPSGVFATQDGWIQISVLHERDFAKLCDVLEAPAIAADSRFADNAARLRHEAALTEALTAALAARGSAAWSERMTAAGLLHEVVNDYAGFLAHPHVAALGAVAWLPQPGVAAPVPVPVPPGAPTPVAGSACAHAPRIGEHTRAVLAAAGYAEPEIMALLDRRIVLAASE